VDDRKDFRPIKPGLTNLHWFSARTGGRGRLDGESAGPSLPRKKAVKW